MEQFWQACSETSPLHCRRPLTAPYEYVMNPPIGVVMNDVALIISAIDVFVYVAETVNKRIRLSIKLLNAKQQYKQYPTPLTCSCHAFHPRFE